jgi:rod shape-determining protein MreD
VALRGVLLLGAVFAGVTVAARSPEPLPDLALPVVVAAGLLVGPSRGALVGLAAGWLTDLVPPGSAVLGTSALLYAVVGLLAGGGRREGVSPVGWLAAVSLACAATLGAGRVVVALLSGAPVVARDLGSWFVLTAGCCVVAVPWLVRLEQWLGRRRAW